MANQNAWQAGWDAAGGSKSRKPTASPVKAGGGSSPDVDMSAQKPTSTRKSAGGMMPMLGKFLGSRKKGGPVKKTGIYLLHKNEYVVPAKSRSAKKASHKRSVIKA